MINQGTVVAMNPMMVIVKGPMQSQRERTMRIRVSMGLFHGLVSYHLQYLVGFLLWMICTHDTAASVVKTQVGLSGMAHSIQRELSTLATTVDTSENKSCNFYQAWLIHFKENLVHLQQL
ncbi:hypothetical protein ACB098_02G015700 [Castanea mollissima]